GAGQAALAAATAETELIRRASPARAARACFARDAARTAHQRRIRRTPGLPPLSALTERRSGCINDRDLALSFARYRRRPGRAIAPRHAGRSEECRELRPAAGAAAPCGRRRRSRRGIGRAFRACQDG